MTGYRGRHPSAREPRSSHFAGAFGLEPGTRARAGPARASGAATPAPDSDGELLAAPDVPAPGEEADGAGRARPDRRLRARRPAHRSRRAADGAAGVDRARRRAVRRDRPERSDRQAPRARSRGSPRCWTASATASNVSKQRRRPAGCTLVVELHAVRPRPLRLREGQLADPAGRDPATDHDPRPGARCRRPAPSATAALEQERVRVLDFLRNEGYFEATVRLDARPGARNPRAVDLYVDIDKGPSYPLGPVTFTGNHALSTEAIDLMFRHAAWYFAWLRPVPFTQKQVRLDIEALEKRYRDLGYFGVRVTTDFSMQKSLDRVAKNVRLAHPDQRAQEDQRRVRGQQQGVVVDAARRADAADARFVRRLRGRPPAPTRSSATTRRTATSSRASSGAASASPPTRSASSSRSTKAPSCACAASSSPATSRCPPPSWPSVVSVRKYPPLGLGAGGYVTGKQMEQDVERIVEHYKRRGFLEAQGPRRGGDVARRARRSWAPSRPPPTRRRATPRAIYVRYTIDEGPRLVLGERGLPHRRRRAPALRQAVPARERHHRARRSLHAGRRSARTAGAWSACSATPATPSASVEPDVDRDRRSRRADLGAEAGGARARRADLRARQLRDHARDDPGADPAAVGRTT